ncbi:MAG: superoxide dismutase [Actinomycetota bacterium]
MAGKYSLPDLPYDYSALEPHIDAQTMEIHHSKHHQTYVDKLNAAVEGHGDLVFDLVHDLMKSFSKVPEDIKGPVRNHGGGHSNHSIFWTIMGPNGGGDPSGDVGSAIDASFGSYKEFQDSFSEKATALFGSGWTWLAGKNGSLEIIQCANQDSPYMEGYEPILGIDVWEHAYYLKYQNKRPDYIQAWWNTLNWDEINNRLSSAG